MLAGADDLLERAKKLKLPRNPLDDLVERLGGPDAVAEMTGRQRRMELQPRGGYSYVSRAAHCGKCSLDDVSALPVLLHRVSSPLPAAGRAALKYKTHAALNAIASQRHTCCLPSCICAGCRHVCF